MTEEQLDKAIRLLIDAENYFYKNNLHGKVEDFGTRHQMETMAFVNLENAMEYFRLAHLPKEKMTKRERDKFENW